MAVFTEHFLVVRCQVVPHLLNIRHLNLPPHFILSVERIFYPISWRMASPDVEVDRGFYGDKGQGVTP